MSFPVTLIRITNTNEDPCLSKDYGKMICPVETVFLIAFNEENWVFVTVALKY